GAQGVHRRRARRHRQHSRRDARWPRARPARGFRRFLPVAPHRRRVRCRVQGHLRLLDPDPDPDLPAQGAPRRGGEGARVTHAVLAVGLIGVSAWAVAVFPRSVLVFLLCQGSLLFAYVARIPSWLRVILLGLALLVLMPTIGFFNGYYLEVATQVGIFVALALGLNIVVGLAGLLDLGYVAFFAVGAYSWVILGSPPANLIFGGDAFPLPAWRISAFLCVVVILSVVILVNRRLENSHIGRAWEAIREDELAAQAMGVPLVRSKLLAFACGASFAGVMGVVFSAKQIFINPESFTFLESIGVLAMVILGGMGSIPGAVLGATVVTVLNLQVLKGLSLWLNELKNAGVTVLGYNLADLPTQLEPAKYERMIFGVILILMMI